MTRWLILALLIVLLPGRVGADSGPAEAAHSDGVDAVERRDWDAAAAAFRRAADLGHADAAFRLATLHEDGRGVEADMEQAMTWYHRAAEAGSERAQFNLGHHYASGRSVERDIGAAARWYRKSAEQDNPHAQFALGLMHYRGEGELERDLVAAYQWLTLAVLHFDTNHFRDDASRARKKVLDEMTDEQEAEGRRRVDEHRAR